MAKESDISTKRDVVKTRRVAKRHGVAKDEDGANIGTTLGDDVFIGDEGVKSDTSEGDKEVAQVDTAQDDEDAEVVKANMEVYIVAKGDEGNEVVKTGMTEGIDATEVLTISDLDYFHLSKVYSDVATTTATSVTAILKAIVAERTDYWKKSIDNRLTLVQKLLGATSFDSAIQIQSEYANKFCDGFSAHTTKMHKFYSNLAKAAFKPIEVLAD